MLNLFEMRRKDWREYSFSLSLCNYDALKNAFQLKGNDVKLKTVLLVDDIYTTGSTMDEAAAALLTAGVERVYFITLACGAGI